MAGCNLGTETWIQEYITPWDYLAHGVKEVLAYARTPYQQMYIIESGAYGKALVLDGKWQSCTGDEFLYHEPLVHPAMIHHGSPRRVLVLGGGEGATVREVLRWKSVERVVMVDIDADVVRACREYLPEMHQGAFDDPRLEVVLDDAWKLLEESRESWDIVISDLSDPIEEGPSFRLFTREYFEMARRVMAEDGVFVLQAGPVSPVELNMHARLVSTMKAVFSHVASYSSHVPSYGSPWGFALGSASPIPARPDPGETDQLLSASTTGGLRMLDGQTLLGMFQIPLHLRQAIAAETRIYTLNEPPKFFGQGQLGTVTSGLSS